MNFKKVSVDDRLPSLEGKYIVFKKSPRGIKTVVEASFKKGKFHPNVTHWLEESTPKNKNPFRDKLPKGRTEWEKKLERLKKSTKCKCEECR